MNEPKQFDPDAMDEMFYGNQGQAQPAQAQAGAPIREAAPINADTGIDLTGTSDELPPPEPLPKGMYDCVIDTVKIGYTQDGKTQLIFTFKVTTSNFDGRLVFWRLTPSSAFGAVRLKQLLSRTLIADAKGQEITLFERIGGKIPNYQNFVDTQVAVGGRTKLTVKPSAWKDKVTGEPRTGNNVTDINLPSDGSFM